MNYLNFYLLDYRAFSYDIMATLLNQNKQKTTTTNENHIGGPNQSSRNCTSCLCNDFLLF